MTVELKSFLFSYVVNPGAFVLRDYGTFAPYIPQSSEYNTKTIPDISNYDGMLGHIIKDNWAVDAIPLNAPVMQLVGDLEFNAVVNGKEYNFSFHYPLECQYELVHSGSITDEDGNTYNIGFSDIPVQTKMFGRTHEQMCSLLEMLVNKYAKEENYESC